MMLSLWKVKYGDNENVIEDYLILDSKKNFEDVVEHYKSIIPKEKMISIEFINNPLFLDEKIFVEQFLKKQDESKRFSEYMKNQERKEREGIH